MTTTPRPFRKPDGQRDRLWDSPALRQARRLRVTRERLTGSSASRSVSDRDSLLTAAVRAPCCSFQRLGGSRDDRTQKANRNLPIS